MARRTKEAAAETRQHILDMALDAFSRKGFSRTTFVDVAEPLGLTKGAVYWHFKTKTDLLVALIDACCSRKYQRQVGSDACPETLAEFRRNHVESARMALTDPLLRKFEFFIHFQIEWSEALLAEVRDRLEAMRQNPLREYGRIIARLRENGELAAEADAERLASLLMASWWGLLRLALIGLIAEKDFPAQVEYGFDLLFRDIAKKEQTA